MNHRRPVPARAVTRKFSAAHADRIVEARSPSFAAAFFAVGGRAVTDFTRVFVDSSAPRGSTPRQTYVQTR